MRMKENKIMKMISRRDFMKASAVVGACRRSDRLRRLLQLHCCFLYRRFLCSCFF